MVLKFSCPCTQPLALEGGLLTTPIVNELNVDEPATSAPLTVNELSVDAPALNVPLTVVDAKVAPPTTA